MTERRVHGKIRSETWGRRILNVCHILELILLRSQRVQKLSYFLENWSVQNTWNENLDSILVEFVSIYFQVGAYSQWVSSDGFKRNVYILLNFLKLARF